MEWFYSLDLSNQIALGSLLLGVIGAIFGVRSYYLSKKDAALNAVEPTVQQTTKGEQSPSIISKGRVSVTYGVDDD